jgi:hypothetical protein
MGWLGGRRLEEAQEEIRAFVEKFVKLDPQNPSWRAEDLEIFIALLRDKGIRASRRRVEEEIFQTAQQVIYERMWEKLAPSNNPPQTASELYKRFAENYPQNLASKYLPFLKQLRADLGLRDSFLDSFRSLGSLS